jgi:protein-L-isoaspartate(D-aspartate) O-methyltransferase
MKRKTRASERPDGHRLSRRSPENGGQPDPHDGRDIAFGSEGVPDGCTRGFCSQPLKPLAYIDTICRLPLADDDGVARYVMEPSPLAKMLQLAEINRDQVVLEIGCGGLCAALLSLLAGSVVAVESDAELADAASERLSDGGYDNVAVVTGDLEKGYANEAPYDVIFFNGAVEVVPEMFDQLREGGRLVAAVGSGFPPQARLFVKDGWRVSGRPAFNVSVKPLPGFRKAEEFVF